MVLIESRRQIPQCAECESKIMNKPIEDPEMKKMFDIDPELYKQSSFLRNIKINYQKYGKLSEKQIETFIKVAEELKK